MIAALYVSRKGPYWDRPGVDAWDEQRDARLYAGPWPVVAHPPCARWCQLAGLVEARYPHWRRGEDGGCFAAALASVREWGGVLEHPAHSSAWAAFGLPMPPAEGWARAFDGSWVCQVDQCHYGHRARKTTWLYGAGINPPSLRWGRGRQMRATTVERMSKVERNKTPPAFADLLISMAESVNRRAA